MTLYLQQQYIPVDKNIVIAFFILSFLLGQMHQLFHHVAGGVISGQVGYLTFDRHYFSAALSHSAFKELATIAGPLFSHYAAMGIGVFLLRSGRYSVLGFSLIFASMPFARLLAVMGGDEQYYGIWLSQPFGSPAIPATIISLLVTLFIVVPPLMTAYKSIVNKQRWSVFLSFLILPVLFYIVAIILPDHEFLVPAVVRAVETGISADPPVSMFWGLPLVLIITTTALAALFFGKYVHYLLPKGKEMIIE